KLGFKLIRESPAANWISKSKFFEPKKEWQATRPKGTMQKYEVYRRKDINWDQIRSSGDLRFIGKTNAEAAKSGVPPQLPDGNFVTLHHIGQDSRGPIAEASTRYHGVGKYGQHILHSQFGKNKPNPSYPIDRKKFNVDVREYWKTRTKD
ncbi:HNH/ENDO VII family nuclease, partial [Bhargavaea beijingensis]|uniref:HNH/ENDO VII family nuclease n=1 Tax=Bhargavaea beijingensis TaxID=426756 RepID=UPI002224FB7A